MLNLEIKGWSKGQNEHFARMRARRRENRHRQAMREGMVPWPRWRWHVEGAGFRLFTGADEADSGRRAAEWSAARGLGKVEAP